MGWVVLTIKTSALSVFSAVKDLRHRRKLREVGFFEAVFCQAIVAGHDDLAVSL